MVPLITITITITIHFYRECLIVISMDGYSTMAYMDAYKMVIMVTITMVNRC